MVAESAEMGGLFFSYFVDDVVSPVFLAEWGLHFPKQQKVCIYII